MSQSFAAVFVHAVFSTKDRCPVLVEPGPRSRVHHYLGEVSNRLGCPSLRVGGIADHVHILSQLGREVTISTWVKELKRVSSSQIKMLDPSLSRFSWQSGYGAFSVDPTRLEDIRHYIGNQEQHHRKRTFQEEFLDLLREHGIESDERYIWS